MAAVIAALVGIVTALGGWQIVLVLVAGILALGAALQQALGNIKSSDWQTIVQGAHDLRNLVAQLLGHPLTQEAVAASGQEIGQVFDASLSQVQAAAAAAILAAPKPRFSVQSSASAALEATFDEYAAGNLSRDTYAYIASWYSHELARLRVGVTVLGDTQDNTLVDRLAVLPIIATAAQAVDLMNQIAWYFNVSWITQEGLIRVNEYASRRLAEIQAGAEPTPVPTPIPTPAPVPSPTLPSGELATWAAQLSATVADLSLAINRLAATGSVPAAEIEVLQAQATALTTLAARPAVTTLDSPELTGEVKRLSDTLVLPGAQGFPAALAGALGLTTVLGGAGVGTLAGSLTSALSATAGPNAHAAQQARYGCMGSFLDPLLGVVTKIGPQIAAGAILATDNPIRRKINELAQQAITTQLLGTAFTRPESYDQAVANAAARLTQAIGFGLEAQAISYTAEAMTPLKTMGFNQIAGFLGDLAGYKRIADGLMGTVEDAAIYQPLRWESNRRYRPRLPSDQVIALMYQKRSLTREELRDYLERLGMPETVISRTPGYIFNDPNPGLLIRAFQMAEPGAVTFSRDDLEIMRIAGIDPTDPDAYYRLKFAKSGLDDTDVQAFVPVVKMGILRREQTLRYGQVERMYRDGMITRERARREIELARVPTGVVDYRMAAMDLQQEYEVLSDFRSIVLSAYGRGHLSYGEAQDELTGAGFDGQRVRLMLLSKRLGLLPKGAALEGVTPQVDITIPPVED